MHNLLVWCCPHGVDLCNQVFTILGPDIDSIASAQGNWPWNIQQYSKSQSQNVNVNERYLSKTRFQLHSMHLSLERHCWGPCFRFMKEPFVFHAKFIITTLSRQKTSSIFQRCHWDNALVLNVTHRTNETHACTLY